MTDTTNIIKELELSLLRPEVRSSRDALNALLAEDFFEFGSSGKTYTKADILQRLPHANEEIEYIVSDFSVETPSRNIAIAKFRTKMTLDGEISIASLRESHWRNNDGTWQMFFHKATPIE